MEYLDFSLIVSLVILIYIIVFAILLKSHGAENPDLLDEIYNRKSVLLMTIAVILYSSPICEKQALFALCKSVKENGLESHLAKKVYMDECFL
jgi:hypothetical protein